VSARRRTPRDERRRRLGQNFLRPEFADRIVAEADFRPGELVIELGAGLGAITIALARRQVDAVAIEIDPVWAERLRDRAREALQDKVRVVEGDFLSLSLPNRPFRVIGSLPFGHTTDVLRRLLDDPYLALERADLIVQWEVARKRVALPPSTRLSTTWVPWWEFRLGRPVPASAFRPVPGVDSGVLIITPRKPPILPPSMARSYSEFVKTRWPFDPSISGRWDAAQPALAADQ
jgi:23S rRNA (adenine-N6)-dimethyltransferase